MRLSEKEKAYITDAADLECEHVLMTSKMSQEAKLSQKLCTAYNLVNRHRFRQCDI